MFVNWRSPPPPLRVTPPAPETTPVNLTGPPLAMLNTMLAGSVTAAENVTVPEVWLNCAVSPSPGTAPFCQFEVVPHTLVPVPPIHVHVAAGRVAAAAAATKAKRQDFVLIPFSFFAAQRTYAARAVLTTFYTA